MNQELKGDRTIGSGYNCKIARIYKTCIGRVGGRIARAGREGGRIANESRDNRGWMQR